MRCAGIDELRADALMEATDDNWADTLQLRNERECEAGGRNGSERDVDL